MTDERLRAVLDDLGTEGDLLDGLVAGLDEPGWRTPTPAVGWDVATSVAHLAWTDEVALLAATDKAGWDAVVLRALADPAGLVDRAALTGGAVPPTELLARWRSARGRLAAALAAYDPTARMPWFGPPMTATSMATARFMESWAHGLDVAEGLGFVVEPSDRVRHVVHLGVRTRGYSFANNGLPQPTAEVRVDLTAPSGALWTYGDEAADQRVTGPAWDFALLVTQRRHRGDLALVAEGEVADRWLDVAQAFAGPRGDGRARKAVR
jgi:uncharacterized protein (TIGR03084 family)